MQILPYTWIYQTFQTQIIKQIVKLGAVCLSEGGGMMGRVVETTHPLSFSLFYSFTQFLNKSKHDICRIRYKNVELNKGLTQILNNRFTGYYNTTR